MGKKGRQWPACKVCKRTYSTLDPHSLCCDFHGNSRVPCFYLQRCRCRLSDWCSKAKDLTLKSQTGSIAKSVASITDDTISDSILTDDISYLPIPLLLTLLLQRPIALLFLTPHLESSCSPPTGDCEKDDSSLRDTPDHHAQDQFDSDNKDRRFQDRHSRLGHRSRSHTVRSPDNEHSHRSCAQRSPEGWTSRDDRHSSQSLSTSYDHSSALSPSGSSTFDGFGSPMLVFTTMRAIRDSIPTHIVDRD